MMKRYLFSLVFISLLIVSGCGYTTTGCTLPSYMKKINVEKFENDINFSSESQRNVYLPLLEVNVRNAVVNRFLFDGNLKISDDPAMADLVLSGKLKNYERGGLRYTDNEDVQEYRIYITVAIQLLDKRDNTVVWKEDNFTGEATYFVTGPQATTEEGAVTKAIDDLARRIVERTIENW